MRTALALLVVLALPASAPATHAARLVACTTGPAREDRAAAFRGAMDRLPGASVLAMRFTLQRRAPSGAWHDLVAPTFDRWERSRPGAARFTFTKAVDGLYAGGSFRARVRFLWRDAEGRPVRSATRWTPACTQAVPSTEP